VLDPPGHSRSLIYRFSMWLSYNFFRGLMMLSVSKKRRETLK
jgi:hypothetical protein